MKVIIFFAIISIKKAIKKEILNKKGIEKIANENKSFENELDQETNKSDSISACSQSIRF